MSFAPIDEDLRRWASNNGFHVSTEYKGYDVRSFELATRFGSVQVWIEPQPDGSYDAVACNNRAATARRLNRVKIEGTAVSPALDGLLALIKHWEW